MPVGALRRGQSYSQIGASSLGKLPATYSVSMSPESSSQATTWSAYPAASPFSTGSGGSGLPKSDAGTTALSDSDYVSVTLVQKGRDISNHLYRFETPRGPLEKLGSEFAASTDPRGNPCMVYYGKNSGTSFWTVSLDPDSQFVEVDIKKQRRA